MSENNRLMLRLPAYAATAGSLLALGAGSASAQVNYSGEKNLVVDSISNYQEIDMDGDGVGDFGFYFDSYSGSFPVKSFTIKFFTRLGAIVNLRTDSYKNSWLTVLSTLRPPISTGSGTNSYQIPVVENLDTDLTVGASRENWVNPSSVEASCLLGASNQYTIVGSFFSIPYSNSKGAFADTTGYVGVRFYIGTNQHYGWIRVSMEEESAFLTIKDWSWESSPGVGISIGTLPVNNLRSRYYMDSGVGKDIKIYPNPLENELHIDLAIASSIKLLNLEGKLFYEGVSSLTHLVDVSDFSPGLYILQINNEKEITHHRILKP